NLLEVQALRLRQAKSPIIDAVLVFKDAKGRTIPGARIEFFQGDTQHGSGLTGTNGRLTAPLPPRDYTISVFAAGQKVADRLPLSAAAGEKAVTLAGYTFGTVVADIIDDQKQSIPCKVEFRPQSPDVKLDFGPETAEFAVRNICYTPNGKF